MNKPRFGLKMNFKDMNKLLLIFVFSIIQCHAWSQHLPVTAGSDSYNYSLCFTVGQVFQAFDLMEAQGVQFPDEYRWYVGVEELKDLVRVYPNPVVDKLTIDTNKNVTFMVYGLDGRLLKSGEGREVEFSNLPPSVYAVKIEIDDEIKNLKIIKK